MPRYVRHWFLNAPRVAAAPRKRLGLWHLGTSIAGFSNLSKYGMVIVDDNSRTAAQALNGTALTLTYSNASGLEQAYSQGMSYATALANGWLLSPQGSNGKWVVDHTIAACNTRMSDDLVTYAQAEGLRGVFLDDVVPKDPYGVTTPAGWRDGMVTFVGQCKSKLNAVGLYLLTNASGFADATLGDVNNGDADLAWAKLLLPNGVMTEEWQESRDGNETLRTNGANFNQHWDGWQAMAAGVLAAGMDFVGLQFNANATYGYASALLQDNGHATFIHATHDGSDPWGAWAVDVGNAIDAAGSNPRRFASATATVNPAVPSATIA